MELTRRLAARLFVVLAAVAVILGVSAVAPTDPAHNPTAAVAAADPSDDAAQPPSSSTEQGAGSQPTNPQQQGSSVCKASTLVVLPLLAPGCAVKKGVGAVKDAAGDGFKAVAKSLAQSWLKINQLLLAWFIKIPTPQYGSDPVIQKIQQSTVTIQLYGLVLSIMLGAFRLVMARRNAALGVAQESFVALAKTVFGAWMLGGVLVAASAGTDALSNWLLSQGQTPEIAQGVLVNFTGAELMSLGSGLVFVVAIVGILGGILQAVLLVGRQAMLAVIVTTAPIAAAFGGTQGGRTAFGKMLAWTIALLLWKPVAAVVYWIAFALAGHDVKSIKDAQMAFYGFILISLTAFVMPMLIKLVSGGMAMAAGSGLSAAMSTAGIVAAAGTMAATGGASGAAGAGAGVGSSTSTAGAAGASPGFSSGGGGPSGGSPSTGGGTGGGSSGGGGGGSSPSTGGGTGGGSSGGGGTGGPLPAGGGGSGQLPGDSGGSNALPSSGSGTGGGFDLGTMGQGLQAVSAATESFFNEDSYAMSEGDVR